MGEKENGMPPNRFSHGFLFDTVNFPIRSLTISSIQKRPTKRWHTFSWVLLDFTLNSMQKLSNLKSKMVLHFFFFSIFDNFFGIFLFDVAHIVLLTFFKKKINVFNWFSLTIPMYEWKSMDYLCQFVFWNSFFSN